MCPLNRNNDSIPIARDREGAQTPCRPRDICEVTSGNRNGWQSKLENILNGNFSPEKLGVLTVKIAWKMARSTF